MQPLIRGTLVATMIAALIVMPATAASPAQQSQAVITSPTNGQAVSGLVPIFGSVTASDFSRYEIAVGPDPNPTNNWDTFAKAEILLSNAQLGVWDSNSVPPGTYAIRLRVFKSDGNVAVETIVRGLTTGPAQTQAPPATPTDVPPPPTLAPEARSTIQPTVIIQQPPTATPTPTPAGGLAAGVTSGTPSSRSEGSAIDLSRFGLACINGVWFSVGAFLLLGALAGGRAGLRWIIKQARTRSNQ